VLVKKVAEDGADVTNAGGAGFLPAAGFFKKSPLITSFGD